MARNNELDMSSGSVMKNVIAFSVPLMLSGILQLLFNAADIIVVGKYVGKTALGAVGATGSLINLITVFFHKAYPWEQSVTVAKKLRRTGLRPLSGRIAHLCCPLRLSADS